MLQICETCVSPEYRERAQQFFNLSTLPERLAGEETLALEYVDVKGNWYTARFIVKKRDAKRKVTHMFYCTRSISEMKRREENWINMVEEASRANAFDEDATRCLDAGMNVHLAKPLAMKELIPVLKVIRRYKFSEIFKSTRKNLKHLLHLPFPPKSSNPSENP